ncbi:hypothetical protein K2X30_11560 [bacterium]|nr:hypothetical protein [bacterium]
MGASRISQTLLIVVLSVLLCIHESSAENTETLIPSWKVRCIEFFHDLIPFRTRRQNAVEIQAALNRMEAEVEGNLFEVGRDYDQIQNMYGKLLSNFLGTLTKEDQWIDVGAGAALVHRTYFPSDFFRRGTRNYDSFPQLTSVAVHRPPDAKTIGPDGIETLTSFEKNTKVPFRYLEGRVQDLKLGKAKVLTDTLAAKAYDRQYLMNPEELYKLYGDILVPGGRAYIAHQKFWILDKNGKAHPFKEYVRKLKGFRVLRAEGHITILERTNEPVSGPAIRLIHVDPVTEGTPNPQCYYEYIN